MKRVDCVAKEKERIFVVHKHYATHLHYDFRLEYRGALKSWAVPKGVSKKKGEKRLAIQVEDHKLNYVKFEGTIPKGQYGAGKVEIWDKGTYELKEWGKDKIEFILKGKKLKGNYVLVKFKGRGGKENWLLFKTS